MEVATLVHNPGENTPVQLDESDGVSEYANHIELSSDLDSSDQNDPKNPSNDNLSATDVHQVSNINVGAKKRHATTALSPLQESPKRSRRIGYELGTPQHSGSSVTTPPNPGSPSRCAEGSSLNSTMDYTPLSQYVKDKRLESHSRSSELKSQDGTSEVLHQVLNTLQMLVQRVERTEKEVKELKRRMRSPSSSDSGCKKKELSPLLRSETRKVYKTLLDRGEDFHGFYVGPSYTWRHEFNQAVVQRLISEVQSMNPKFPGCDIRDAAYTYYKTVCQEDSLDRRGKSQERKKTRRRRERILRKLQERQTVFKRRGYEQEEKKKWLQVLVPEMMSSEESEDEEKVNYVKLLPWRSETVKQFFDGLDGEYALGKSAQAKRQTKDRLQSTLLSARPVPTDMPDWALCNT